MKELIWKLVQLARNLEEQIQNWEKVIWDGGVGERGDVIQKINSSLFKIWTSFFKKVKSFIPCRERSKLSNLGWKTIKFEMAFSTIVSEEKVVC